MESQLQLPTLGMPQNDPYTQDQTQDAGGEAFQWWEPSRRLSTLITLPEGGSGYRVEPGIPTPTTEQLAQQSITENFSADFWQLMDGYKALGSMLAERGPIVLWEVAKHMPGAIYQSYKRWVDAAMTGRLDDEIKAHPLHFIQDVAMPLSLVLSGGTSAAVRFGGAAGKVANILQKSRMVADGIALASDPIGGAAFVAGRYGIAAAWRKAMQAAPTVAAANPLRMGKKPDFDFDTAAMKQAALSNTQAQKFMDEFTNKEIPETVAHQNIRKFKDQKDVQQSLKAFAKTFDQDLEAQRRGTVEWNETAAAAMGVPLERVTSLKPGEALNPTEMWAAISFTKVQAENTARSFKKILAGDSTPDAWIQAISDLKRLRGVATPAAGAASEAGRTLAAVKEAARVMKLDPDTNAIVRLAQEFGGKEGLDELVQAVSVTAERDLPGLVNQLLGPDGKLKVPTNARAATRWDKIVEVGINWGMLSGPRTHVVNTLSNTLVSIMSIPERGAGALAGKGLDLLGFKRANPLDRVYLGETGARAGKYASIGMEHSSALFGMVEGGKRALRAAKAAYESETPAVVGGFKDDAARFVKEIKDAKGNVVERIAQPGAVEGKLGRAARVPGRLLLAEDAFFQTLAYNQELHSLAYRRAMQKGLREPRAIANFIADQIADPDLELRTLARESGKYQTFTKQLHGLPAHVQRALAEHPMMRLVIPFVRTPWNIVEYAAERTPVGWMFKNYRQQWAAGGATRDMVAGRTLAGTAIMGAGVTLAAQGYFTGGGPTDPRQRAALRASGWQPYSLRLPSDIDDPDSPAEYFSYSRIEPLGIILGLSADFPQLRQYMTHAEADKFGAAAFAAVMRNFGSKTWLAGLSNVMETLADPERNLDKFLGSIAAIAVPNTLSQIGQTIDPTLRQTQGILDRVQLRLPGLRNQLPALVDIWGNEIQSKSLGEDTFGRGINLFSPVYMTGERDNDNVNRELYKLAVYPDMPSRTIGGADLTPDQHIEYTATAGREAYRELSNLIASRSWSKLPDETKTELIWKTIHSARADARQAILGRHPELMQQPSFNFGALRF